MRAANTPLNVEILGVNVTGEESFNEDALQGRILPWLQDTQAESVWTRWDAAWRDVRIIDSQNRLVVVYNLFEHDLTVPENREALKQLFLQAAAISDSDKDQLPDDWELKYFGNLSAKPGDDADGDRIDNFTEFALGTNPVDAASRSSFKPKLISTGGQNLLSLTFRRRAGSILDYAIESSPNLFPWTGSAADIAQQSPKILFDGTGTAEVTCSLKSPVTTQPFGFLRVKAIPRPKP